MVMYFHGVIRVSPRAVDFYSSSYSVFILFIFFQERDFLSFIFFLYNCPQGYPEFLYSNPNSHSSHAPYLNQKKLISPQFKKCEAPSTLILQYACDNKAPFFFFFFFFRRPPPLWERGLTTPLVYRSTLPDLRHSLLPS